MLPWLAATTAPMISRIDTMEIGGKAGSKCRTTRWAKWLTTSPRATGSATICRMLSSRPCTSTAMPWDTYSRVSSGVATTPTTVDSALMGHGQGHVAAR